MIRLSETRALHRAQAAHLAFFNAPIPLHTSPGIRVAKHLGDMIDENLKLRQELLRMRSEVQQMEAKNALVRIQLDGLSEYLR